METTRHVETEPAAYRDWPGRPNEPIRHERWTSTFSDFARWTSKQLGHPVSFALAVAVTVLWLGLGPVFHFSDTWQLVMATGASAVTFLMVFLLQSSQNRESQAMQLKLDELIRAVAGAHNALVSAETMSVAELEALSVRYANLALRARDAMREGIVDASTPLVVEVEKVST